MRAGRPREPTRASSPSTLRTADEQQADPRGWYSHPPATTGGTLDEGALRTAIVVRCVAALTRRAAEQCSFTAGFTDHRDAHRVRAAHARQPGAGVDTFRFAITGATRRTLDTRGGAREHESAGVVEHRAQRLLGHLGDCEPGQHAVDEEHLADPEGTQPGKVALVEQRLTEEALGLASQLSRAASSPDSGQLSARMSGPRRPMIACSSLVGMTSSRPSFEPTASASET